MEPEGKQRKRWTRVERLAYHEAGHAVMCHLLGGQSFGATIIPDARTLNPVSVDSASAACYNCATHAGRDTPG